MRRCLDRLYRVSGALAAIFLTAICVVGLLQVGANLIDAFLEIATYLPARMVARGAG